MLIYDITKPLVHEINSFKLINHEICVHLEHNAFAFPFHDNSYVQISYDFK